MKQKLSLVTLGVNDLDVSKKFYEESLGFVPTSDSNKSVVFYDMDRVVLGLYNVSALANDAGVSKESNGFSRFVLAHNEPSTEAVDALFVELRKKKVTIVKLPEKVFWGGYSGYFSDPDGHLWEVAFNPFIDLT